MLLTKNTCMIFSVNKFLYYFLKYWSWLYKCTKSLSVLNTHNVMSIKKTSIVLVDVQVGTYDTARCHNWHRSGRLSTINDTHHRQYLKRNHSCVFDINESFFTFLLITHAWESVIVCEWERESNFGNIRVVWKYTSFYNSTRTESGAIACK